MAAKGKKLPLGVQDFSVNEEQKASEPRFPVNHKAWAEAMKDFIQEKGMEREFQDWCGGWPCPVRPEVHEIVAAIQAVDTFKRKCASCGKDFKDGETCPRGGCPMGGDF